MHNELGITKEDIRQWIQDAVKEQAELMVKGTFENYGVEKVVKNAIINSEPFRRDTFESEVKATAGRVLAEKLLEQYSGKNPHGPSTWEELQNKNNVSIT